MERTFSKGRILLPHVRNRLSGQSVRAILCVGEWSRLGLVKDQDIKAAASQPMLAGAETVDEVAVGWDDIIMTAGDE